MKQLPGTDFGPVAGQLGRRALTMFARVPLPIGPDDRAPLADSAHLETHIGLGFTALLSGRDGPGLGIVVLPHGEVAVSADLQRWTLGLKIESGTGQDGVPFGFAFDRNGVTVPQGAQPAVKVSLGVSRRRAAGAPGDPAGLRGHAT